MNALISFTFGSGLSQSPYGIIMGQAATYMGSTAWTMLLWRFGNHLHGSERSLDSRHRMGGQLFPPL